MSNKSQREVLRVQVLDLHRQGIGNSEIARRLGINRQRAHDIIRSGRTTELPRGLKSRSSVAAKIRSSRDATIPPFMHVELQAVLQSLRNTAIEHGFRFYLEQQALQTALQATFGLSVPLRTLLRYQFGSVKFQHYTPKNTIGEFQFPFTPWVKTQLSTKCDTWEFALSWKTLEEVDPGKRDFRSIFVEFLLKAHALEAALPIDRRNAVQVDLHHRGVAFAFGDIIQVAFAHTLVSTRPDLRHVLSVDHHELREIFAFVVSIILDPAHNLSPVEDTELYRKLFQAFETSLSFPGIHYWRSARDIPNGVTKTVHAFFLKKAVMSSLLAARVMPADMQRCADQMTAMLKKALTMETIAHPALQAEGPHVIRQKRKDLVKIMIQHGWDYTLHPGRPEDEQLLYHR